MCDGSDETEYRLLTQPGAVLTISLCPPFEGLPVIHLLGNREGMLSLANVLLWLHANSSRREFLSITALPFVHQQGMVALSIRVLMEDSTSDYGWLQLLDKGQQFEWRLPEDDLKALGLIVHRLACLPGHGYDRLPNTQRGMAWVWLELLSNRLGTEDVGPP
jgi:hypothetical protein